MDTMSTDVGLNGNLNFTINQGHDLIFSGNVTQLSGVRQVVKEGVGTLTITGLHNNTNVLTINRGTASVNTIFDSGVASSVGAGTQINFNANNNTAVLNYTGAAQNTNRKISMGNTGVTAQAFENAGSRINNNGSGALVFTNAAFNTVVNVTATSSRTLVLGGANTAANQISGVIANNTGDATGLKVNLTKEDAGTWILAGNNTYTGTTTVNGGILQLDKTGSTNTAAIASTSALTLGGGEFNIKGKTTGTTTQTLGALTLSANSSSKISVNKNGGTSTTLTLGDAWTRNAGSSLVIDYSASATGHVVNTVNATTGYTLTNGIYGGILVKDTTGIGFATRAAGASQTITRYNSASNLAVNSDSATTNYTTVTTGSLTWSSGITNRSVNSLTIDTTTSGGTIDMGASSNVLTLTSGAILFKGTNNSILTGGQVGASGSEVIVHQTSGTNTLTINSLISASTGSLTKSGAGTLNIGGTNTYTGATAINEGKLTLSGTGSLNSGSYAGAISLGTSATLQKDSSGNQTLSGNITGLGSVVMNASTATMVLEGTNSYTGATTVNAGTLTISDLGSTHASSAVTVSNSGSALIVNGTVGGSLLMNANTTLSGKGTITGNAIISGTHNPGNSPGIQTFSGNLAYVDGGTPNPVINWELNGNTVTNAANPNAIFDQIIVSGNLDFTDPTTLNLILNGTGSAVLWLDSLWSTNQSWTLFDVAGTTTNFDNLDLTTINWLDSGSNLFNSSRPGSSFSLSMNGQDVLINYTAVPETSTALLSGLGALALLRRRRN